MQPVLGKELIVRKFVGFIAVQCLFVALLAGCSGSAPGSAPTATSQPLTAISPSATKEQVASSTPVPAFPDDPAYMEEKGIVYATVDDVELILDLYKPMEGDDPFPAIVFLHAHWTAGDRESYFVQSTWAADRGYVAVTIDRRSVLDTDENSQPKYPFPAPLHDVKCAVRWLRSNAEELGIDPDRIGAVGYSAGGHYAMLLALTDPSDGLEGDCGDLSHSSRIQAVVNLAGDPDLALVYDAYPNNTQWSLDRLLGGNPEEKPEEYRVASPITYVTEDDPPVLTIRGELEGEAFMNMDELFDLRLEEAGVSHTLVHLEFVGHSGLAPKGYAPPDIMHDPDPELYETIFRFLDTHLKFED
jgi:acetyl esterase/lipase